MKKSILLSLFLLCSTYAFAQNATGFRLSIDVAAFRYEEEKSFVEIYYGFPRSAVTLKSGKVKPSGSVLLHAVITTANKGDEVATKTWRVPVIVSDTSAVTDQILIGKVNFILDPGKYKLTATAQDEGSPLCVTLS